MNLNITPVFIAALFILTGCVTKAPLQQDRYVYTKVAHSKKTSCGGMTDTARYVATEKLKRRPRPYGTPFK